MLSFDLSSTNLSPPKLPSISKFVPDLSKLDYTDLAEHLLDVDFSDCLLSNDVNHIWGCLSFVIRNGVDYLAPKVKLRPKNNNPPWFNSNIRHHLNCIRSLRKKYGLKPSTCNKMKLENAEDRLLELMSAAKSSYESQLVEQFAFNNSNKIFKYIKSIINTHNLPVLMHLDNKSVTSECVKAALFNSFFESVYSKESISPDFSSIPKSSQLETLDLINITDLDVYTALSELDPTKACGIDGIGPKVLRSCALALYQVIHHLLSICLWYCDIATQWKLRCIVPIHKSGDKSVVSTGQSLQYQRFSKG